MRVQDLKQQTAIRLAQEQQQRRNADEVYENNNSGQQQQPVWNSSNTYSPPVASYQTSNTSGNNGNYDYNSRHAGYHQDRSVNNNSIHYPQQGNNNSRNNEYQGRGWENGGFFPVETYGPPSTDHHVEAATAMTPPSTPRNRRHHSKKSTKSSSSNSNREVGSSRVCSSSDEQARNKIKNTKSPHNKLVHKKKDARRNNSNINATDNGGAKPPPQSPVGTHSRNQASRQQHVSSPHNMGGAHSMNNSQPYNYQHMQLPGTQVMNSPRRNHHHQHQHYLQKQRFIATPNGNGSSSSKLPHGLTVQELKEMTKARLAAEAFEAQGGANNEIQLQQQHLRSGDSQRFSPAASSYHTDPSLRSNHRFRHHHGAERQRLHSSESVSSADFVLRQRLNSAETAASAPATTKYNYPKGDLHHNHQGGMPRNNSHNSLIDFQYHPQNNSFGGAISTDAASQSFNSSIDYGHYYNGSPSPNHFNSRNQNNNQDAFETGSVNSFNSELGPEFLTSSDYPAAYPKGYTLQQQQQQQQKYAFFTDEDSRYAFGRSCSYPSGTNLANAIENARDASAFSPCHSKNNIMNRSRAATASPPGLSHVLEDRPVVDQGISGNFSTSSLDMTTQSPRSIPLLEPNPRSANPHGKNNYESNSNSSSPLSSRFTSCNFIPDADRWYDIFGRPSSSTTVPTIEPSSESFCVNEDEQHHQQQETLPISSSLGTSNHSTSNSSEALPNYVAESVLGTTIESSSKKCLNVSSTIVEGDCDSVIGISGVFRNVVTQPSPNHQTSSISRNGTFDSGIIGQGRFPTRVSGVNSWCDDYQITDKPNLEMMNGSENFANSISMSRLADDLNSLLNTDGDGSIAANSRYNQFLPALVSKIDPELDVSTPQPSLVANSSSSISASIPGDTSLSFLRNGYALSNEDTSVCSNVCQLTSMDQFQKIPASIEPKRPTSPQRKSNSWAFDYRRRNTNQKI